MMGYSSGYSDPPSFEVTDTNGDGCITNLEFDTHAQEWWPTFADIASLDGISDCISTQDFTDYQHYYASFEAMADGDECITEEEFDTHAQEGWPTFADVASSLDCISRQDYIDYSALEGEPGGGDNSQLS